MKLLQVGHLHRALGNRLSGAEQCGQIASLDPNAGKRGVANDLTAGRWLIKGRRRGQSRISAILHSLEKEVMQNGQAQQAGAANNDPDNTGDAVGGNCKRHHLDDCARPENHR